MQSIRAQQVQQNLEAIRQMSSSLSRMQERVATRKTDDQ